MPLKSVTVVLDVDPGAVAVNLTVIPARLSVVFCPAAAVTLPMTDADVAGAAVSRCCAKAGIAQINMANSNASRSGYRAPSLPLRHSFNDTLHYRTETRLH